MWSLSKRKVKLIFKLRKVAIYLFSFLLFAGGLSAQSPVSAEKLWNEFGPPKEPQKKRVPNYRFLSKKSHDAIVNIFTTQPFSGESYSDRIQGGEEQSIIEKFLEAPPSFSQRRQSLGSGFIINKDGYFITNAHLVDKAVSINVFHGKDLEIYRASLVGLDRISDIALLKIDSDKTFPFLYLGDSSTLEVGEWVMAVGNPFGFANSVTQGIVSAKGRDLSSGMLKRGVSDFIQTDASINPGNSGGPLLNWRGEVVGINAAISTGTLGIGFAIPVNVAKAVLPQLKSKGTVIRGYFGVIVQSVTPLLSEGMGLKTTGGAMVVDVIAGSPALTSGIKSGDIISEFAGKKVADAKEFHKIMESIEVRAPFKFTVIRNDSKLTLEGTLSELAGESERPRKKKDIEVNYDILGLKIENTLPYGSGVSVNSINPDGPAYRGGFSYEDIIFEIYIKRQGSGKIDRYKIKNDKEYAKIIKEIKSQDIITAFINRFGSPMYLAFKFQ